MRDHLGEEFSGMVSSATSFGLFVTLDSLYVEGLIHITELGGEYFRFDEVRQELRGERTGIRYAIGTRVRIQVSRVDLDGRKIDFRLVPEGLQRTTRSVRERPADRKDPRDALTQTAKSKVKGKIKARNESTEPSTSARPSPIQALKSAVKKAAASKKSKSKKPRR
jgi:ribonuclease R